MEIVSNILKKFEKWYLGLSFESSEKDNAIQISIRQNNCMVGGAYIKQYPGCCGIAILTGVNIYNAFRNLGFGSLLVDYAIEEAKKYDYTILEATTNHESPSMEHLLLKKGFVIVNEFKNKKTNNHIKQYRLVL